MAFPPAAAQPDADAEDATASAQPADSSGDTSSDTDEGSDTQDTDSEVLKNHLYLPKGFPSTKPPEAGDKKKFIVEAEFVETNDAGEECWSEISVDGVPIESEDEDEEDEDEGGDDGDDEGSEGDDESQEPDQAGTPPSKVSDVTAMIMRGGK